MSSLLPIVLSFFLASSPRDSFRHAQVVSLSPDLLPRWLTPVADSPPSAANSVMAESPVLSVSEPDHTPEPAEIPSAQESTAPVCTNPKYSWKTDIVATVFWVGEQPTQNNPVPNTMSSWDTRWVSSFGGYDDPDPNNRTAGFHPVGFRPRQNPFYIALPYNDILNSRSTKEDAARIIPWFKDTFQRPGRSVCHNRWLAIHHKGRVCYAQWSDCGPFKTNDGAYVFGSARPANTKNAGAGVDISPAVRDFLQLPSGGKCDWRFVDLHEVGDGPWKHHGNNNPFASKSAPAPEGVFTAVYTISATKPAGRSASAKQAAVPVTRKTPAAEESGSARLNALRRARDQWFSQK
jgi:hypothetical protein